MTTPIGQHPALAFPWNKRGSKERRAVLDFLTLARNSGIDTAPLLALVDLTRADLTDQQLGMGDPP